MPGFNFAKGNAKKLVTLPLYALGALASLLVPRSPDHWVFGCGSGIGEGALALYREARTQYPGAKLHWLARDEIDRVAATALGIPATIKSSARGLILTLRSKVIVITHGFGDVNRYGTRGAFIVQLWHGVPLKLIQLDSPATTRIAVPVFGHQLRRLLRGFYRRGYRRAISLMPVASPLVAERFRTAFGLPSERIAVTGDPRDDVLSTGTADDRRRVARSVLLSKLQRPELDGMHPRMLLFAPTWRDGQPDPALPTPDEWSRIDAWLQAADAELVIRPHPLGVGNYTEGSSNSDRIHLLTPRQLSDLTPVLSAIDLLITDYSSVAFDYSLTGGPILFIAPDQDSYAETRGLYEPYRQFSGGREIRSWGELLDQLGRYDHDDDWAAEVRAHSTELAERHFAFQDGRNTDRVLKEIALRLPLYGHPEAPRRGNPSLRGSR